MLIINENERGREIFCSFKNSVPLKEGQRIFSCDNVLFTSFCKYLIEREIKLHTVTVDMSENIPDYLFAFNCPSRFNLTKAKATSIILKLSLGLPWCVCS